HPFLLRALSAQIAPARLRVRRLPDPALVPQGRRAESASPRSTPLMRRRWPSGHALALLLALVVIAALTVIVASPLHRTFYLRFRTERITAAGVSCASPAWARADGCSGDDAASEQATHPESGRRGPTGRSRRRRDSVPSAGWGCSARLGSEGIRGKGRRRARARRARRRHSAAERRHLVPPLPRCGRGRRACADALVVVESHPAAVAR